MKNLLLFRNTAIPVRSDTLRIFSSGKDATDLNRSEERDAPPLTSAFAKRRYRYKAQAKINRRRIFDTLRINFCAVTQ